MIIFDVLGIPARWYVRPYFAYCYIESIIFCRSTIDFYSHLSETRTLAPPGVTINNAILEQLNHRTLIIQSIRNATMPRSPNAGDSHRHHMQQSSKELTACHHDVGPARYEGLPRHDEAVLRCNRARDPSTRTRSVEALF